MKLEKLEEVFEIEQLIAKLYPIKKFISESSGTRIKIDQVIEIHKFRQEKLSFYINLGIGAKEIKKEIKKEEKEKKDFIELLKNSKLDKIKTIKDVCEHDWWYYRKNKNKVNKHRFPYDRTFKSTYDIKICSKCCSHQNMLGQEVSPENNIDIIN